MKSILAFAGLLSLAAAAAHGQHTLAMHTHAGTGGYSACVNGRFNRPIELYPKDQAGNLDHTVSTNKPFAQSFFNQGLTFFYGFDSESAMRSFHQASVADPELAMAYWGVALAAGGDLNIPIDDPCMKLAKEQIKIASGKSAKGPEKLYIEALAKYYAAGGGPERYVAEMKSVYQQLGSQDPDAGALYVYGLMNVHPWKWWPPSCQSTDSCQPTKEIAEALLVLKDKLPVFSTHIGLNHLYIHAMEEAPISQAVKAKDAADFLHKNAPFITPHLRHMPAHTYLLGGDWQGVIDANLNALNADGRWLNKCQACIPGPECNRLDPKCEECNQLLVGHYFSHDLLFYAVGHNNRGQWDKVLELSKELEGNVRKFIGCQPGLEHYLTTQVMMMVHFGKWEMLTNPKELPPPLSPMPSFESPTYCADLKGRKLAAAMWYFGRVMGNASLRQPTDVDVRGFEKARECVGSADPGWGNNPATAILNVVYWRMLERIARMKDLPGESELRALQAVKAEDSLSYDEPPGWYVSSRETYGAALFLAKKYKEAEDVFREDQRRRPNNSRSLFGLWQVLKKLEPSKAAKAEKDFRSQWVGPDPKMEDM